MAENDLKVRQAVKQTGQALLSAPVTADRHAAARHDVVSRKTGVMVPVDQPLEALAPRCEIAAVVPGFPDAPRIARPPDLLALAPRPRPGNSLVAE